MKNQHYISPTLLVVFLTYIGCKGEEKPVSSFKQNTSIEEARNVQIEGIWVIDSLTLAPVTVPSFCNQIGAGATFEFTEDNSLKVYPEDASEPCETFSYTAQQGLIHLKKGDMLMLVEVESLTDQNLVLRSNSFFRWQGDPEADSLTHQILLAEGTTAYLSRK
ncbi:hypothetical protein [Pontibacter toksunensis]